MVANENSSNRQYESTFTYQNDFDLVNQNQRNSHQIET